MANRHLSYHINPQKYKKEGSGIRLTDVTAMAKGIWVDSLQKTPFFISDRALKEDATNWTGSALLDGHSPSVVGLVDNQRYDPNRDETCCDIVVTDPHTIDRVLSGKITDVSPEIKTVERWNSEHAAFEILEIEYTGLALVPTGACKTCKIRLCGGVQKLTISKHDVTYNAMTCGCDHGKGAHVSSSKEIFSEFNRKNPSVRMLGAEGHVDPQYLDRLERELSMAKGEIVSLEERLLSMSPTAEIEELKTTVGTLTARIDEMHKKQREMEGHPVTDADTSDETTGTRHMSQGNILSVTRNSEGVIGGGFW